MYKIDRDGITIAGIACCASLVALFISTFLSFVILCFALFTLYFFRDPERFAPYNNTYLLSPADGKVLHIKKFKFDELYPEIADRFRPAPDSENASELLKELENDEFKKVSIFMNVFNVHVNRAPLCGVIKRINYIRGRFFNASLDKASQYNERCIYRLDPIFDSFSADESKNHDIENFEQNNGGIVFVQIAGLIARRIRTDIKEGLTVGQGQRIGLIRFGSRVDVYFRSSEYKVKVAKNQTTIAGETLIAKRINMKNDIQNNPITP